MLQYLIRRVLIGFITLFLVTFVVYGLVRSMPGDPALMQLAVEGDKPIDAEDVRLQRVAMGLEGDWHTAYFTWIGRTIRGDLGNSYSRKTPVSDIIAERIGPTLLLSLSSLFLTYLLSIPLGLLATVRSGKIDERVMSTVLYMLYSFPSFVAALFLQIFFAIKLAGTPFELPLFGMQSSGKEFEQMSSLEQTWDILKHSILPVTCFTYASLAYYSRFIRSNMHEVIRQDYIRTARAKGVGPVRVVVHHAFRNTLIPLVTMIGLTLPTLLSGAIILEQIFSWPGMGRLFFESLLERDYPTIMGLVLMFSILTLIGQLLADVFYSIVDPRITYS